AHDLLLDAVDQPARQHHLLARNTWPVMELAQAARAALEELAAELDHVAAEHVVLDAQPLYLVDDPPAARRVVADHLDRDGPHRIVRVRPPHQQGHRPGVPGGKEEPALHAGEGDATRPGGALL